MSNPSEKPSENPFVEPAHDQPDSEPADPITSEQPTSEIASEPALEVSPSASNKDGWFRGIDTATEWGSEWLNPILVKEGRQSLKSLQFTITFGLLLICCWGWTILGLSIFGPEARYAAVGQTMFTGYYLILSFPLIVIVPFGAFRSLASEQEDRTYELMCISTLRPTRIVLGKLGSASLQIMLYLSAVSPCLAFTYMLRGIALPNIFMTLLYTALISMGLSMIGLMLSTLSSHRHWQVVLSVFLIAGLLLCFIILMNGMIRVFTMMAFYSKWYWIGNAMMLTGYITYFALVFFSTVARITFASDNRSTRLRVVMLIQHLCLIAWFAWYIIAELEYDILTVCFCLLTLHWYIMGGLMTGESKNLSLRVRRNLPTSFLGRGFLTWFNPGPGTGYLFAICGLFAGALTMIVAMGVFLLLPQIMFDSWDDLNSMFVVGLMSVSYLTIYLGLGLLLLRLLRRWELANPFVALLIQVVLLALGILVPMVANFSQSIGQVEFSLLQITNPFWTITEIVDRRAMAWETTWALVILMSSAGVIFLINLPSVIREVRYVRIAEPARVVEDDLQATASPS